MIVRACLALTFALLLNSVASAHPFHSSTTEIEWNKATGRFEVAMRLRIADTEDALSAAAGRRVSLESDDEAVRLLQEYLKQHFSVTRTSGQQCLLHWVGMELELHDAWVYFEAEPRSDELRKPAVGMKVAVATNGTDAVQTWDALFGQLRLRPRTAAGRGKVHGSPVAPVIVRNSVLFDLQPEQENVLTVTCNSVSQSAVLNRTEK